MDFKSHFRISPAEKIPSSCRRFAVAGPTLQSFSTGKRCDEIERLFGRDDDETVGLLEIAGGIFARNLFEACSSGGGQTGFTLDLVFDPSGKLAGQWLVHFVRRDIEKGLVERQRFDEVGDLMEDLADLFAHFEILLKIRADEDSFGTEAVSLCAAHGGTNAVTTRFVGRSGDDSATLRVTADDDGTSPELGAVALLDGGEKRVHVDVDDLPGHVSLYIITWGLFRLIDGVVDDRLHASARHPFRRVAPR